MNVASFGFSSTLSAAFSTLGRFASSSGGMTSTFPSGARDTSSIQTVAGPSPVKRGCMVAAPGGMMKRALSSRQPAEASSVRGAYIQLMTWPAPSRNVTDIVALPVPCRRAHARIT